MGFETIKASPKWAAATPQERATVANNYFSGKIAAGPAFERATPQERATARANFLKAQGVGDETEYAKPGLMENVGALAGGYAVGAKTELQALPMKLMEGALAMQDPAVGRSVGRGINRLTQRPPQPLDAARTIAQGIQRGQADATLDAMNPATMRSRGTRQAIGGELERLAAQRQKEMQGVSPMHSDTGLAEGGGMLGQLTVNFPALRGPAELLGGAKIIPRSLKALEAPLATGTGMATVAEPGQRGEMATLGAAMGAVQPLAAAFQGEAARRLASGAVQGGAGAVAQQAMTGAVDPMQTIFDVGFGALTPPRAMTPLPRPPRAATPPPPESVPPPPPGEMTPRMDVPVRRQLLPPPEELYGVPREEFMGRENAEIDRIAKRRRLMQEGRTALEAEFEQGRDYDLRKRAEEIGLRPRTGFEMEAPPEQNLARKALPPPPEPERFGPPIPAKNWERRALPTPREVTRPIEDMLSEAETRLTRLEGERPPYRRVIETPPPEPTEALLRRAEEGTGRLRPPLDFKAEYPDVEVPMLDRPGPRRRVPFPALEMPRPEAIEAPRRPPPPGGSGARMEIPPPSGPQLTQEPGSPPRASVRAPARPEAVAGLEGQPGAGAKGIPERLGMTPEQIDPIFADWADNRLYVDNSGTFRVKAEGKKTGPVAPYNKALRAKVSGFGELHEIFTGKADPAATPTEARPPQKPDAPEGRGEGEVYSGLPGRTVREAGRGLAEAGEALRTSDFARKWERPGKVLSEGAAGEKGVQRILSADTEAKMLEGDMIATLEIASEGLSRSDRKWLAEQAAADIQASGKAAKPPSPAAKRATDAAIRVFDEMGAELERLGVMVEDPRAPGGLRPFKRSLGDKFVPRVYSEDALTALQEQRGDLYDAIVKQTELRGIDPMGIVDVTPGVTRFAPGEKARVIKDVPTHVTVNGKPVKILETDLMHIAEKYVTRGARRAGFIKEFGQQGAQGEYERIYNDILKTQGSKAAKIWKDMWADVQGQRRHDFLDDLGGFGKGLAGAENIARGAQLSASALPNIAGFLPAAVRLGIQRLPGAVWTDIKGTFQARTGRQGPERAQLEEDRRLNAWRRNVLSKSYATEDFKGWTGKASTEALKATGVNAINRYIQKVTGVMAREALTDSVELLRHPKNGTLAKLLGQTPDQARRMLKVEFDFSDAQIDQMIRSGVTKRDLAQALQRAVAKVNVFQESPLDRPHWMGDPLARRFMAYQSYVRSQGNQLADAVARAKGGDFAPLATTLLGYGLAGMGVEKLRDLVHRREREDRNFWAKLGAGYMEMATFGLLGSLGEDLFYGAPRGQMPWSKIPQAEWLGKVVLKNLLYDMPKSFMEDGAGAAAEKGYINLAKNTPALRAIDAHAGGPAYQDRPENRPRAGGRLPVPRGLEGSRREMRVPPRRVPERTIPRRRARLED